MEQTGHGSLCKSSVSIRVLVGVSIHHERADYRDVEQVEQHLLLSLLHKHNLIKSSLTHDQTK